MTFGSRIERVWRSDLEHEISWMNMLARRLVHGEEEARELVQETWLTALTRPPADRGRPRAWLRTVMANLVRQGGRRAGVRRQVELGATEPSEHDRAAQDLEERELEQLLRSELATLVEPFRSTLEDHYLHGLQLVQIARRDGVPEGTVRWRLKTGLERLRLRLDARYGDRRRWLAALLPSAGPRRARPTPRAPFAPLKWVGAGLAASLAGVLLWSFATDRGALESTTFEGAALADVVNAADLAPTMPSAPLTPSGSSEPTAAPASPYALSIRVVDAEGAAVAGAELALWTARGFEPRAWTGADGRALLHAAPLELGDLGVPFARGRLVVRARADGHATSEAAFLRAGAADELEFELEIALRGPERILRGRVKDDAGQPLEGVHVHAVLDPVRTMPLDDEELFHGPLAIGTQSAADGSYELRGLERKPYVVVVSRAGCEPSMLLVGTEKEELPLFFVPGGRIRGRIVDEHGQPAAGARVWIDPPHMGSDWCAGIPGYRSDLRGFTVEAVTDLDGRYELVDVHARLRRLCAREAGDEPAVAREHVPVPSGQTLDWSAFLAPEPGYRLHLMDESGHDLPEWVAVLVGKRKSGNWTRAMVADAHGRVVFDEGSDEADLLVYGPSGQGEPRYTRPLRPAHAEQPILVPLETPTRLFGRIPTEYLAQDPEASVIAFHRASRQPFTLELERENGRFRAELAPADYAVLLSGSKGAAWLADVELARGERRRLGPLPLPETGHVLLRADHGGHPGNWRLVLCFPGSSMKYQEGALPLLEQRELMAGLYRLDASGSAGWLESAWIAVEAGRTAELDLARLTRVELEVRESDPAVSRHLRALVFPATPGEPRAPAACPRQVTLQRRPDGSYRRALRLPQGPWVLELHDEHGRVHRSTLAVPAAGVHSIEVEL